MLTSIRKQAHSWVVKVLFALLIAAFAVWGIGDVFRSQQIAAPILEIGDDYAYSRTDFDRELRLALQRLSQIQGMQVTPALFAQFGGAQRLVDQAENKGLMQVYGSQLGFDIPLSAAIQFVETDPEFAGATGRFDRPRFEYMLRQLGQSEEQYVANVRAQMRSSYLVSSLTGAITAPEFLARTVLTYTDEQRVAETVSIADTAMTDIPAPDEAALTAWHTAEAARYQAPEYRAGLLVQMVPSDFIQDVAVSDEEIADEYQARQAEFSTPETRDVEQVVVQDQAIADKVIAAVKAGTVFDQAVRDATGGEPVALGQVTKEKLPAEIADTVFTQAAGTVSDALKSPFGLHVVYVSSVTPGTTRSLAEVQGELRNGLALGRAADAMESVRIQLEDELAGGASLADAAKTLNLHQEAFAAIDSAGQDQAGGSLGISQEAVGLIFNTQPGDAGYVTPLSDGSYAIAQVDEITPPTLKPLDQVRDQVSADWMAAQQKERAKTLAQEIADKVKGGADLATEAAALGLSVATSKPFHRGEGDPESGVAAQVANDLFKLKTGDITVGDTAEGAVVARLIDIKPVDPASQPDEVARLTGRVGQTLANDLQQSLITALKSELPVSRHDEIWQSAIQSTSEQ